MRAVCRLFAILLATLVCIVPAAPAMGDPPHSPFDDIALVERMTPNSAKKADSKTGQRAGKVTGRVLGVIPSPSTRGRSEVSQGAVKVVQASRVRYVIQPREDGLQVSSVSRHRADRRFEYQFPGTLLEPVEGTGFVVVRDEKTREPIAFIEPAWAKDGEGKSLSTSYSTRGDTLVQHVDVDSQTSLPVVADPRVRWTWYGASIDFSKSDTEWMSLGFAACLTFLSRAPAGVPGAVALACGALAVGAQAAVRAGRCLSIKWVSTLGPAGVTWWLSRCYA